MVSGPGRRSHTLLESERRVPWPRDEDPAVTLRSPFPDVDIPDLSVTEYVVGPAAARADAVAVIDGATGEQATYAELSDEVAAAARTVTGLGVGQGDVVALMSRN